MRLKNINRKLVIYNFAILILALVYSSCSSSGFAPSSQSFGGLNKIVVVADQDIWEGPVGDTLRFYLGAAYPVLPQPEPLFDLQHFTTEEINENKDRLRFRNILYLADVSNSNSPTGVALSEIIGAENIAKMSESELKADVKISNNRWAVDQIALFFYSEGEEAAMENIKSKSSSIAKMIREHDYSMIKHRLYYSGKNVSLSAKIKEEYGMGIDIPGNYVLVLEEEENNFMWIRKLEKADHTHHNILIQKIPYTSTNQLKPENVKVLRDTLGRRYIESGQIAGSFMRVNDVNLPLFHEGRTIKGKFGLELKGIWEMSDDRDMMGGPFMSYMMHDASTDELIFVDAFIFAPGKKKRDLMQGMEYILSTITFDE